jgi:hypothetical protein
VGRIVVADTAFEQDRTGLHVMALNSIFEVVVGLIILGLWLAVFRPLLRLYHRRPAPTLLRNEMVSELLLLVYFSTFVFGVATAIHGIL